MISSSGSAEASCTQGREVVTADLHLSLSPKLAGHRTALESRRWKHFKKHEWLNSGLAESLFDCFFFLFSVCSFFPLSMPGTFYFTFSFLCRASLVNLGHFKLSTLLILSDSDYDVTQNTPLYESSLSCFSGITVKDQGYLVEMQWVKENEWCHEGACMPAGIWALIGVFL